MEGYRKIAFFFLQVWACQGLREPGKSQGNAGAGGNTPEAGKIRKNLHAWEIVVY